MTDDPLITETLDAFTLHQYQKCQTLTDAYLIASMSTVHTTNSNLFISAVLNTSVIIIADIINITVLTATVVVVDD